MGLAHGDKIAFLMDNGLFTAQLFLGTMYGGFVAVPLNARAGVSQLSYTLENCDAKIVFVGRHYAALIKDVLEHVRRPLEVVSVDEDAEPVAGEVPDMGAPPLPVQKASEVLATAAPIGQEFRGPGESDRSSRGTLFHPPGT